MQHSPLQKKVSKTNKLSVMRTCNSYADVESGGASTEPPAPVAKAGVTPPLHALNFLVLLKLYIFTNRAVSLQHVVP